MTLPKSIAGVVVEAGESDKGDTATSAMKNAVLDTGAKVLVPLFYQNGGRSLSVPKPGLFIEKGIRVQVGDRFGAEEFPELYLKFSSNAFELGLIGAGDDIGPIDNSGMAVGIGVGVMVVRSAGRFSNQRDN